MQELYDVEHFAIKTVAVTFWRLPVIFLVMFIVRGQVTHFLLHSHTTVMYPHTYAHEHTHAHMHALEMCIDVYTCMHVLLACMFCWHACFARSHLMQTPDDADT